MAKRDADAREKWGKRIGGLVLALTDAPATTKAWASGAAGEERLATALDTIDSIRVLHDRRVPGTPANIDHLVIGPGGVFVVDSKNHKGTVAVRDRGGVFRTDVRLYVGSRDWSRLADGLLWQMQAVASALENLRLDPQPAITPALCFVEADLAAPPRAELVPWRAAREREVAHSGGQLARTTRRGNDGPSRPSPRSRISP